MWLLWASVLLKTAHARQLPAVGHGEKFTWDGGNRAQSRAMETEGSANSLKHTGATIMMEGCPGFSGLHETGRGVFLEPAVEGGLADL
jgi:hypothetical protein